MDKTEEYRIADDGNSCEKIFELWTKHFLDSGFKHQPLVKKDDIGSNNLYKVSMIERNNFQTLFQPEIFLKENLQSSAIYLHVMLVQ